MPNYDYAEPAEDYSQMYGPVIGPLGPIPFDEGYLEPPEGDVWKGLPYPDDLYSEDNGTSSNRGGGMFGGIKGMIDKVIKASESAADGAGGGGSFEDMICY